MLRRGVQWSRWTGLRLSSTLTNTEMNKDHKISEDLVKKDEKCDINIVENEKFEIEKVIKTGKFGHYMDRVWETDIKYRGDKEYHKISDPYFEAHKPFELKIEMAIFHDWGFNRIDVIKRRLRNWINYREENRQKYYHKRHAILGPELAIAHSVVVRGGKVKFEHDPEVWATRLSHFPNKYNPKYKVTEVDASDIKLRSDGLDNFQEVFSLRTLNLSSNKLDDWSCDKMGRLFRNLNIESLDISDNPLITNRGIETLHRIRSLKELKIKGTAAAKYPFIELLILSFTDLVPDCRIIYE